MADDITPKQKLQTQLYKLGLEQDKCLKVIYEEIGKIAVAYNPNKDQIEEKKRNLQFFEGIKNGLSQASKEVGLIIPDNEKEEDIYKTIIQLRNWIRSSNGTPAEDKEILGLANILVKLIGEE
jgi:hypothetical protein